MTASKTIGVTLFAAIFGTPACCIQFKRPRHYHTYTVRPCYWRMWELLAFQYVETSVDKNNKPRKINSMQHVLVAL